MSIYNLKKREDKMNWFGYLYIFMLLASGIYTVVLFYKGRPQYILGEFLSTFLAIWVVLVFFEHSDLPTDIVVFILMAGFVLFWEGVVNLPLIKEMVSVTPQMHLRDILISALISIAPFIYMTLDIVGRYSYFVVGE